MSRFPTLEIAEREAFLLGVIGYLDDMDCWYLDEAPEFTARLKADFGFVRDSDEEYAK